MKNQETAQRAEDPPPEEKVRREKDTLAEAYACNEAEKPEWCVSEVSAEGGKRVLHFIRPSLEAEFVARRIARLGTALGVATLAKNIRPAD